MTKSSKYKYTVSTSTTKHVTITIDRSQLWLNFIEFWGQNVLENASSAFASFASLKEVYTVLVNDYPLIQENIANLFKQANTCILMGDAMKELDKENILRTIVIKDCYGEDVIVNHKNIVF